MDFFLLCVFDLQLALSPRSLHQTPDIIHYILPVLSDASLQKKLLKSTNDKRCNRSSVLNFKPRLKRSEVSTPDQSSRGITSFPTLSHWIASIWKPVNTPINILHRNNDHWHSAMFYHLGRSETSYHIGKSYEVRLRVSDNIIRLIWMNYVRGLGIGHGLIALDFGRCPTGCFIFVTKFGFLSKCFYCKVSARILLK